MKKTKCKCYFCRKWVLTDTAPQIRVDPTEGPSEYTVGRVCRECKEAGRHLATDTEIRLGNKVEYPHREETDEEINAAFLFLKSIEGTELDENK